MKTEITLNIKAVFLGLGAGIAIAALGNALTLFLPLLLVSTLHMSQENSSRFFFILLLCSYLVGAVVMGFVTARYGRPNRYTQLIPGALLLLLLAFLPFKFPFIVLLIVGLFFGAFLDKKLE